MYCNSCYLFDCRCSDNSTSLVWIEPPRIIVPMMQPELNPTRFEFNTEINREALLGRNLLEPTPPGGHMGTALDRSVHMMTSPTLIQRDLCGGIVQVGQIGPF